MKPSLEDLLSGVPAQEGNGGTPRGSSTQKASKPLTTLEKTSANAKQVLEEEAEERAEKMARLKAAREARDKTA
ncbi:hypothetical protein GCM10011415_12580 [Salipiger pallidus]|uniref:Uncharacterized protein n=1 Tax=Salipiger pallidus TaxID=1775170 RepID=A0A8J3EFV6_9RHOB|nr:hypothetical protein [Salipiger pallidus]GGG67150.1 hypothetical protein GCM10011415_12580 [Salipiger pallidus]